MTEICSRTFSDDFERVTPKRVDQLKYVTHTYKAVLSITYSTNFDGGGCRVRPSKLAQYLDMSERQLNRIRAQALANGHLIKKGVGRGTSWFLAENMLDQMAVYLTSSAVKRQSLYLPSVAGKAVYLPSSAVKGQSDYLPSVAGKEETYYRLPAIDGRPIDIDLNTKTKDPDPLPDPLPDPNFIKKGKQAIDKTLNGQQAVTITPIPDLFAEFLASYNKQQASIAKVEGVKLDLKFEEKRQIALRKLKELEQEQKQKA